jgi:hypothetical protein
MAMSRSRLSFFLAQSPLAAAAILTACGSGGKTSAFAHDAGGSGVDASADDGGGDDSGGGDDGGGGLIVDGGGLLRLTPSNATLFIDTATTPPTPATQAYIATIGGADVTAQLTLTLQDTSLGTFTGPNFTSATSLPGGALGVTTLVTGTAGQNTTLANLTLVALRKTGPDRDFYFVEPYQKMPTPANDELKFSTKLQQVDVAILLDTTGSMSGSIANVQTNLTKANGILTGLQAAIPNVGVAIVDHRDYPYDDGTNSNGASGDWPVKVWQPITTNAAMAQAAVNNYALGNGMDDPESQIPAMHYLLTGQALTWPASNLPAGSVPAHTPASGTEGGVDFRPGSFRVVVQITDSPWHNYDGTPADSLATPYAFTAPDYNALVTDFSNMHAKYVGIVDDHNIDSHPHVESQALSDATGSNVPAAAFPGGACNPQAGAAPNGNCRLNFDITDGNGLDTSIVQAIQAISIGATFDVTAIPANDPANVGGVDATKFIQALRAMGEGDPSVGCPKAVTKKSDPSKMYDDVFVGVTAGTSVCFEVIPAVNTIVPPTMSAQFFHAFINVVGLPGNTKLDQRSVLFLVPPADVGGAQ